MVEMQPGRLETPFVLCTRCWIDGVRRMADNGPTEAKKLPVVTTEMADALKKSGWQVTDAAPGAKVTKKPKRKAG